MSKMHILAENAEEIRMVYYHDSIVPIADQPEQRRIADSSQIEALNAKINYSLTYNKAAIRETRWQYGFYGIVAVIPAIFAKPP